VIVLANDIGIDDEAGTVRTTGIEEINDALCSHGRSPAATLTGPFLVHNREKLLPFLQTAHKNKYLEDHPYLAGMEIL
jgi:hypothetical protein